jgi:Excalibur calcium-binding domain
MERYRHKPKIEGSDLTGLEPATSWVRSAPGATAVDTHTSGKPVTNFLHSDRLYKLALSYNHGLDRDKDGMACQSA